MQAVRAPAVAGLFYPAAPGALQAQITDCLRAASIDERDAAPKVVIVPHAGYVYSGEIAAHAYARLARWRARIRRVVLLGPAHRVPLRGLAAPEVDAFETPLGSVPLDRQSLEALGDLPQVRRSDLPHEHEHSLEVQLPFLQTVLEHFILVPLVVGNASPDDVSQVVERLWGGDETLVVISTDLSHYLPYAQSQVIDRATVQRILALATDIDPDQACGASALNGALQAARRHGLAARLLDLRNSGDTAGDRRQVVGYAALALEPAVP